MMSCFNLSSLSMIHQTKLRKQSPSSLLGCNYGLPKASNFAAGVSFGSSLFGRRNIGKNATYVTKFRDDESTDCNGSNETSKPLSPKRLQEVIKKKFQHINNEIGTFFSDLSPDIKLALAEHPFSGLIYLVMYDALTQPKLSEKPTTKLDDVKGQDAIRNELLMVVSIFEEPNENKRHLVKQATAYLFVGEPKTGKTFMAKAVAGQAKKGVEYIYVLAKDYAKPAAVRNIFQKARKYEPCVVIIDQMEALGEPALSQFLIEIEKNHNDGGRILIIAITNKHETLPWELIGYTQYFKKIQFHKPDKAGRQDIFASFMGDVVMEKKERNCALVAELTDGFHAADLKSISTEARQLYAQGGYKPLTEEDILKAVEIVKNQIYAYPKAKPPYSWKPKAEDSGEDYGYM